MNLRRLCIQGQVTVITAVITRRRIATHDALQQYPARQLQAPSLQKTLSRHHLATRHAVEIGRHAFDFINTTQQLSQVGAFEGTHLLLSLLMQEAAVARRGAQNTHQAFDISSKATPYT